MEIVVLGIVLSAAILSIVSMRTTSGSLSGIFGFISGSLAKKPQRKVVATRNRYRATSIVPGRHACEAVKKIGNRRFLDVDNVTPPLPLRQCDAEKCDCKYAHFGDRRDSNEDRRLPFSLQTELYDRNGNQDRRDRERGRRKNDWA